MTVDPLGAVIVGSGVATALAVALRQLLKRKKSSSQLPALPTAPSEPLSGVPAAVIINDAIHTAASQHWLHESTHKVPFDERQRHTAATQRATRLIHAAKLLPPADLKDQVKTALEKTKGVAHG